MKYIYIHIIHGPLQGSIINWEFCMMLQTTFWKLCPNSSPSGCSDPSVANSMDLNPNSSRKSLQLLRTKACPVSVWLRARKYLYLKAWRWPCSTSWGWLETGKVSNARKGERSWPVHIFLAGFQFCSEDFCILERMAKCTLNRLTSVFILKLLLEVKSLSKPPKKGDLLDKVPPPQKKKNLHLWSLSNFCHLPEMPYLNPSHTDTHLTYTHPMDNHYCPIQGRVFRCGFQGASPTVRPFGAIKVDETKLVRKCSQPMLGLDLNGAKKTSPTWSDVNPTVGGRPQSPHCVIASELLSENSPSWGNLDMAEGKTKSVAFTIIYLWLSRLFISSSACGILHPNESHPQNSFQWIICRIGICAKNALSSRYCSLWPMLWLHL